MERDGSTLHVSVRLREHDIETTILGLTGGVAEDDAAPYEEGQDRTLATSTNQVYRYLCLPSRFLAPGVGVRRFRLISPRPVVT